MIPFRFKLAVVLSPFITAVVGSLLLSSIISVDSVPPMDFWEVLIFFYLIFLTAELLLALPIYFWLRPRFRIGFFQCFFAGAILGAVCGLIAITFPLLGHSGSFESMQLSMLFDPFLQAALIGGIFGAFLGGVFGLIAFGKI